MATYDDTIKARSLNDWLAYLERIDPSKISLGLERASTVAKRMQLNSFRNKTVVEVAGTNGKGSVCAFLSQVAFRSGIKVGMYTSPHLISFTERININNKTVSERLLCEAFCAVFSAKGDIELTYFEFTTLAALYCFAKEDVDLLILEVGLGGRLDAVNIIDADIAVITSIGLDHVDILGETTAKIAYEKVGILKSEKTLVLGVVDSEARDVIMHEAFLRDATVYQEGRSFTARYVENSNKFTFSFSLMQSNLCMISSNEIYPLPKIPRACVSVALFTALLLQKRGLNITNKAIEYALENSALPCRMQKVTINPTIYIDVAHNVPAVKNLIKTLNQIEKKGRRVCVLAMLKDKDYRGVIEACANSFDVFYIASTRGVRGLSYHKLLESLALYKEQDSIKAFDNVEDALSCALKESNALDEIIVFGSFVTAAATYKFIHTHF